VVVAGIGNIVIIVSVLFFSRPTAANSWLQIETDRSYSPWQWVISHAVTHSQQDVSWQIFDF